MKFPQVAFTYATIVWLTLVAAPVFAQISADNDDPEAVALARDAVRSEMTRIEDDPNIEETVQERALEVYAEVLQALDARDSFRQRAIDFTDIMDTAPQRIQDIRQRIAEFAPQPVPELDEEEVTEGLLQRAVAEARMRRDAAQAQIALLAAEDQRRADRRQEITQLLIDARAGFEAAAAQAGTSQPGEHPAVNEAQRLLGQARMEALQAEIEALEREYISYDIRTELMANRQREAQLIAEERDRTLRVWQDRLAEFRRTETDRAARAAREAALEAARTAPAIRDFAEESVRQNAELVERRTGRDGVLDQIERAQQRLERITARTEQVRSDFEALQERVETVGTAGALAPLFQNYRETLPYVGLIDRRLRLRERQFGQVQVERLELRQELAALEEEEAQAQALLASVEDEVSETDYQRLEEIINDQLAARQRTLSSLLTDYDEYLQALLVLDAAEQDYRDAVAEFRNYISQRALWMRSTVPISLRDAEYIALGLRETLEAETAAALAQYVLDDLQERGYWYVLAAAPLLFVTFAQFQLRRRYIQALEAGGKWSTITIRHTFIALGLLLLRKGGAPFLVGVLGWRLTQAVDAPVAVRAVGEGGIDLAVFLFSVAILYDLCRPKGICSEHLAWTKTACDRVRKHIRWYMPIVAPAVFVLGFCAAYGAVTWTQSLGRIALLVVIGATMVLCVIALRPHKGFAAQLFNMHELQGSRQLMGFAEVLAQVFLLFLAVTAMLGYHDTAVRLSVNAYYSVILLLVAYLVFSIGARWLLVGKRKLAMEKMRERDKEADEEQVAQEREELIRISEQTRAMWSSACWITFIVLAGWLWADEVPALQGLQQVELWTTTETHIEPAPNPEGGEETITREVSVPVTLLDLAKALALVVVGSLIVRNAPGFLETAVFRHTGMGSGERYAFNTLLQYLVTVIVVVWALGAIGLGWGQVQWLVAALSVGLGFGLQEIFANFVSGIIVLFERPVRVGDIISVNGQSGTVTKIRIRSTSIRDFDRKELVVPNKDLVTGQLLNWTLSDAVQRVVVPVGIAYGADTDLAEDVLWQVVRSDSRILEDPAPQVYYLGFGDSALEFEVRAFCPTLTDMLPLRHDLHKAIDKAFREAGIEIAFPQRDLHFRGPLEIVHRQEGASETS